MVEESQKTHGIEPAKEAAFNEALGESPQQKSWRMLVIALVVATLSTCVTAPVGTSYIGGYRARRFCAETQVGSNIDDFRKRAQGKMDMVIESPPPATAAAAAHKGTVSAMATGFVFLRSFCVADYEDDKIVSTRVTNLD